jgi:hypothetical protein
MSNGSSTLLLSWDQQGLEAVINVTEYEKAAVWAALSDSKTPATNLNHIVTAVMLRARYNSQRHYEIYTINVAEGITEDDIRQMFEDAPQQAADLIRERGNKMYSDRVEQKSVKIV